MAAAHPIEALHPAYERMAEAWTLIHALNGGTRRMRAECRTWLPMEVAEKPENYARRVARSILHNGYGKTRDDLLDKPFSRPIQYLDGIEPPTELQPLIEDVDLKGTGLTEFARRVMEDAYDHGVSWILVEMPTKPVEMTRLNEGRLAMRPYFIHLQAEQLTNWTEEYAPNGAMRLTSITWSEAVLSESASGTGQIEESGYRRMSFTYEDTKQRKGTWEVWRKVRGEDGTETWQMTQSGVHTFVGLPLHPLWIRRVRHMEARPVMEDQAWLNLAHFQSDSDQRNNLRFGRVGILFGSGFTQSEVDNGVTVGPSSMVLSTNERAQLSYVEHSGGALAAGRQDLLDLEARMEVLGLAPLMERRVNDQTATGAGLDAAEDMCALQTWARLLEMQLLAAYRSAAAWYRAKPIKLDPKFGLDVYSEFQIPFSDAQGVQNLLQLWQAGAITHKTLLGELKRRAALHGSLDVEKEAEAAATESPGMESDPLDAAAKLLEARADKPQEAAELPAA